MMLRLGFSAATVRLGHFASRWQFSSKTFLVELKTESLPVAHLLTLLQYNNQQQLFGAWRYHDLPDTAVLSANLVGATLRATS